MAKVVDFIEPSHMSPENMLQKKLEDGLKFSSVGRFFRFTYIIIGFWLTFFGTVQLFDWLPLIGHLGVTDDYDSPKIETAAALAGIMGTFINFLLLGAAWFRARPKFAIKMIGIGLITLSTLLITW